jgi:hypothetical protein
MVRRECTVRSFAVQSIVRQAPGTKRMKMRAPKRIDFLSQHRRLQQLSQLRDTTNRRAILVGAAAMLFVGVPLAAASAGATEPSDGIYASIESIQLKQEAVKVRGQLRAKVTIRNRSQFQKSGYVLAECRDTTGMLVEQSKLQVVLEPGETTTLWFTIDVGEVKGVGLLEIRTGSSSSEAPFEVY